MNKSRAAVQRELQAAGRYLLANELAWGNAGNLSARLEADTLLVTASGTRLGELSDDDFVVCPVDADEAVTYRASRRKRCRCTAQSTPRARKSTPCCTPRRSTAR